MKNTQNGQLKQKDNILVRWWKLTEPNKAIFAAQIIFNVVSMVLSTVLTIFAARTINCMYDGDWKGSFIYLGIELGTLLVAAFTMHMQYYYYTKECSHIRLLVANKIYNKFLSCKVNAINSISTEKATNIALNNMTYMTDFTDQLSDIIGTIAQITFTLIVVFMSNVYAGLIVIGLGIINFFAYYLFNKKLGSIMLERYEKKDDMFRSYSKIIDGKLIIKELNAESKYKEELTENVKKFNKAYSKYYMLYSTKVNIYYAFWNVIIYAIAALMLYFVSHGTLDIAIYLIIIPYLNSCTTQLNALFDQTGEIENMRVDVDRVNLILQLSDEELVSYGDLNKEVVNYNLGLINVCEYKKEGQKYTLKNVNMHFKTGKVNVVKGPKGEGKRVIVDILRRYNVPDSGKAVLDNLNLFDYNEKTFKTHINYCASHPDFIKGTIKENLTIVNKDMRQIEKLCAELGILNDILSLPNGFDSNIYEIKSSMTLFMLGLIRALLTNCKILMIYDLPQDTTSEARLNLIKLVKNYNIDKTLILFTHDDTYNDIADNIYKIEKGVVTNITKEVKKQA